MCNTRPLARVDIRTGLREVFTDRLGSVELKTHVLKAIAKNPGERYATAGELADDLRRIALKEEFGGHGDSREPLDQVL